MAETNEFWFLHERGYTAFEIPRLTYPEIFMLIDKHNEIERQKARNARKARRRHG